MIRLRRSRKLRGLISVFMAVVMVMQMVASASAHNSDIFGGTYFAASPISLSQLNFAVINAENSLLTLNVIRGGVFVWGGQSSRVRFGTVERMTNTEYTRRFTVNRESIIPIVGHRFPTTTGGGIVLGEVVAQNQNGAEVGVNSNWYSVEIRLNSNPLAWGVDSISETTRRQRATKTVMHEVGHVLKLAHPARGASSSSIIGHNVSGTSGGVAGWYPRAVMNVGFPNNNVIASAITAHDGNNLRAKWGA